MSISRTENKAALTVDEGVPIKGGWLTVDLAGLPRVVPKPVASASSAPVIAPVVHAPAQKDTDPAQDNLRVESAVPAVPVPEAPPTPRVPLDRVVVIGNGSPPGRSFGRRRIAPSIANDNKALPSPARKPHAVLRELFFLAILAATLAGTFYTGQVHAIQKVIVIPEPMNPRSVLT